MSLDSDGTCATLAARNETDGDDSHCMHPRESVCCHCGDLFVEGEADRGDHGPYERALDAAAEERGEWRALRRIRRALRAMRDAAFFDSEKELLDEALRLTEKPRTRRKGRRT